MRITLAKRKRVKITLAPPPRRTLRIKVAKRVKLRLAPPPIPPPPRRKPPVYIWPEGILHDLDRESGVRPVCRMKIGGEWFHLRKPQETCGICGEERIIGFVDSDESWPKDPTPSEIVYCVDCGREKILADFTPPPKKRYVFRRRK